jgi:hypothetical protein
MAEMHNQPTTSQMRDAAAFDCSHAVRLTGREWLVVAAVLLALVIAAPAIWEHFEMFTPDNDHRLPYQLSDDYWLYHRYCRRACEQGKVLIIGDSVIWGHYVRPGQSLTHCLNEISGGDRFANLGVDGIHPVAMEGLIRYYGRDISRQTVLLHLNPLWMSSARHDLQTPKEFHFNHPDLVPQFTVTIPCYRASLAARLGIVARRTIPFCGWLSHVRAVHFQGMSLSAWTIQHPYGNPITAMQSQLPGSASPESSSQTSQARQDVVPQEMEWVGLDSSLQWRFFRRAVALLRQRDNRVFVLVGPFNEHLLTERSRATYAKMKDGIEAWLRENDIPYLIPPALGSESYVDASHPQAEGYALLARTLMESSTFISWLPSPGTAGR